MADKTVLHDLNAGMVLDRSVLINLSTTDIGQTIVNIRAAGNKPLYVIEDAETLFTPGNLVASLGTGDKRYLVINEALGGFFTDQQMQALVGAVIKPAAIADGDLIVNLGAPPKAYTYAQVPQGWSINDNMSLGANKIRRKIKNSDDDGCLFFMSPQDFEKLWHFAAAAWAGVEGAPLQSMFTTGMGKLKATVQDDRIALGGNYIRRYEIEQIAKYRNWAVPIAA